MAYGQPAPGDLGEAGRSPGRPTPAGISGTERPARADRAPVAGLAPRLALAALLLAVVLAGIRAAVPATDWANGPWHSHGTPLGIGLELVFIALLTALELRRRREPTAAQPTAGLRALLRAVLLIGVVAIPVLILINGAGKLRPGRQRSVSPPRRPGLPRSRLPQAPPGHGGGGGAVALYVVLVLVLLAAVVACVILLRRRARAVAWNDSGEVVDDESEEQLRRAVRSGQAALRDIDDARLAIIACYVAMERSLARAGATREEAETPDELLARAAGAGLVHGGEAGRLTELFYEARFSSHPLAQAKRQEAQQALEALAESLGAKAAAEAAAAMAPGPDSGPAAPEGVR
jgi:hypothetical protein